MITAADLDSLTKLEGIRWPIANASINNVAKVRYAIHQAEADHWFSGLRTAELTYNEQCDVIEENLYQVRKSLRTYERDWARLQQRSLQAQKQCDECPESTLLEIDSDLPFDIEQFQDDLRTGGTRFEKFFVQLRDAFMERDTAKREYDRIRLEHSSEIEGRTFMELQEQQTLAAMHSRQCRFFAGQAWASSNGLSLELAAIYAETPRGDGLMQLDRILKDQMEIQGGIKLNHQLLHTAEILHKMPPEHAQRLMALASTASLIDTPVEEAKEG